MEKVTLIVPAYNEEEALRMVVEEGLSYVDEVVIVDDGSSDHTPAIGRELAEKNKNVRFVSHEVNQGKVGALRTGITNSSGDILIFTDADYTYPSEHFPALVESVRGGADLAVGSRFMDGINNMPLLNRVGNMAFSFLATYIAGIPVSDAQSGLRAMRKAEFPELDVEAKSLEFETKMTVRAAKLGYNISWIPIRYRPRVGKSKLNPVRDGFKMFFSVLSVAYTESSMLAKSIMIPSVFVFLAGLAFGLMTVADYLDDFVLAHEFYPLVTVFLMLFGSQIFSMGLLVDNLTKKIDRVERKIEKMRGR